MKNDFDLLLRIIKAKTGDNKSAVAKKIGIARETLSRAISSDDKSLYELIKKLYINDIVMEQPLPTIMALQASVSMLYEEVAILKSDREKISQKEANEIMKIKAASILESL